MEEEEGAPSSTPTRAFSLRIVTLDYYMANPLPGLDACYSSLQGRPIAEVPVVRIFGTTLAGQKTCLHLHKAFPYFYVPYDEDLPQDITEALAFVRCLASAIEKALKLASSVGAKRQHVYSCSLVRGKKFYGFHSHEQLFVKIVLFYPQEVPRLSTLLLGGGILNRPFQPHESHIPFLLQIMIDHNLAGMGHVHLSDIKFRQPMLENRFVQLRTSRPKFTSVASTLVKHMASSESLTADTQGLSSSPMEIWCRKVDTGEDFQTILQEKQSSCELEGDAPVEAILNRHELLYIPLAKAGPEVKMVQSLIPIWEELDVKRDVTVTGKGKSAPPECYVQAAPYEQDFHRILEKIIDVHEQSSSDKDGGLGGAQESSLGNDHGEDPRIGADASPLEKNALLMCTQAHSKGNMLIKDYNENEASRDTGEKDEKDVGLLDEDMIKHQLTQSSQDTDEEAVELLRWMISSQKDNTLIGYASDHEKVDDETSWSQVFQCADEALAKAISDYEHCSQQECQAIIECLEEDAGQWQAGVSPPQGVINKEVDVFTGFKEAKRGDGMARIPQFDGSCDEEMPADKAMGTKLEEQNHTWFGERRTASKSGHTSLGDTDPSVSGGRNQQVGWGPLSVKRQKQVIAIKEPKPEAGILDSHEEDDLDSFDEGQKEGVELSLKLEEQSLRDLMRRKRMGRQQARTVVSEGSSPVLNPANTGEDLVGSKRACAEDGCCGDALVSSSLKMRFSGEKELVASRYPEVHTKRKYQPSDHPSRFGPLPIVKTGLLAASSIPCFTAQKEIAVEECYPSLSPKNLASSLQGSEMSCHDDGVGSDACAKAPVLQAGGENCDLVDCENRSEGCSLNTTLSSKSEPPQDDKMETCVCPSMNGCEEEPFTLAFCKKPPTVEHLCATFESYNLSSADHGHVFYGKSEDLPDQPAVMAGMIFEVMSKDAEHLSPYQFSEDIKGGSLTRTYASTNVWAPSMEDDSVVLPSHFQNDGTVLFLLSPAKLPPTVNKVCGWLRQWPKGQPPQNEVAYEHCGNCTADSQGSWTQTEDASQSSQVFRPSSPKYDETFMLPFPSDEGATAITAEITCQPLQQSGILRSESGPTDNSPPTSKLKLTTGTGWNKDSDFDEKFSERVPAQPSRNRGDISQISGPTSAENHFTPMSQAGFRDPATTGRGQQISVMSIEVFASTRGDLRPDPRYDAINCITVVLQDDDSDHQLPASHTVALLCDQKDGVACRNRDALIDCEVVTMKDEASLLQMFVWLVRIYDPDMLVGWEIQGFSLGLLAERAANLGIGLLREISRLPVNRTIPHAMENAAGGETECNLFAKAHVETGIAEASIIDDEWGRTHGSGIHVSGRVVLNLWRIMRDEIKLGIYTLEAVAEAVLKRKVPLIPWRMLTQWFSSGSGEKRHHCIEYCMDRARLNLQIMDQLDLVNRTSELARVFGIDFFSVLSRGSQYRVESMMLRVAHSQNYLLISPSRQQVASQPAMQCLPLVMEPESRFYTDPVVVLDFQSLYPSMMIAYNLCFSTCLGKVVPDNPKVLGVTSLDLGPSVLKDLKDCLTFTPNGIMFASAKIRPGVLPRLLDEILSTRIMVKQSMKKLMPSQKVLQRVLNARQLALKLISNVTYGYTAAGFSGRMPCAELADSIVQSGRYTLENAINFVNTNTQWNARVVYGDTDSMFVLLKGRTREEAFKIGEDIAAAITALNPDPVTLKMEKVYHPCVLLTKKRYVGYSYESPKQLIPNFDAKGIETVRRDSCGAVAKTLEQSLRILFETHDISQVKAYLQRQWGKILSGRISIKDFIYAKEVRLGSYSARASVLPPAAIVATKAMSVDPRAEPRYGERIPYLVVHGEPGARLVDMVVNPYVLVNTGSAFRLHDTYYITKQIIPALQRIFGLIGVDLNAWYSDMPRLFRVPITKRAVPTSPFSRFGKAPKHMNDATYEMGGGQMKSLSKRTIDHYYLSQHCMVCGDLIQASNAICESCSASQVVVGMSLLGRSSRLEREFKHLQAICRHCGGGDEKDIEDGVGCISLACSIFYERIKLQKECRAAVAVTNQYGFT